MFLRKIVMLQFYFYVLAKKIIIIKYHWYLLTECATFPYIVQGKKVMLL